MSSIKSPAEMSPEERKQRWKNFTDDEISCSHCGKHSPSPQFTLLLDDAQTFRTSSGHPLPITSGYRCPRHPIEAKKNKPGWHSVAALDFGVTGELAIKLMHFFLDRGYKGVGVNQKGSARFIHVDRRTRYGLWSY